MTVRAHRRAARPSGSRAARDRADAGAEALGEDVSMSSPSSVRGVLRRRPPTMITAGRPGVEIDGTLRPQVYEQIREFPRRETSVICPATVWGNGEHAFSRAGDRQPGLAVRREILVELVGCGGEPLRIVDALDRAAPIAHEQRTRLQQTSARPSRQPLAVVDLHPPVRGRQRPAVCVPRVRERPVRHRPAIHP
jgi:hypothetical protein